MNAADWVPVAGYKGRYIVSRDGEIISICRGKPKAVHSRVYKHGSIGLKVCVRLIDADGKCRQHLLNRIVWASHMGPIPDGYGVYHKNGILDDNRLENLQLMAFKKIRDINNGRINRKTVAKISKYG